MLIIMSIPLVWELIPFNSLNSLKYPNQHWICPHRKVQDLIQGLLYKEIIKIVKLSVIHSHYHVYTLQFFFVYNVLLFEKEEQRLFISNLPCLFKNCTGQKYICIHKK